MRAAITTAGEVIGIGCIVYGLWQLAPWLGWVALGTGIVFIFALLAVPEQPPAVPAFMLDPEQEHTSERPVVTDEGTPEL
jgi:hypothetical protein